MPVRKKALLVGDFISGTGFYRITKHIREVLIANYEVHQVALGYHGKPYQECENLYVYPELAGNAGHMGHKFIGRLIEDLSPELFFIIHDFLFIRYYLEAFRYQKRPMLKGAYLALDGQIVKARKMIAPLKGLDFCVLYTEFAYKEVQNLLKIQPSLLRRNMKFLTIPHGIETDLFFQLPDKINAKRHVFPSIINPERTIVFLNGNRPVPRKRVDITLEAFAKFVKGKSPNDVRLYLHHTFSGGKAESTLQNQAKKLGIESFLLEGPMNEGQSKVDNTSLNLIYNACDVGINTCMGEGWGLVNCEHGTTGAPQILPRHTGFPEIWKDSAVWLEEKNSYVPGFSNHEMFELNSSEVAEKFELLYNNPVLREEKGQAARQRMKMEKFQWKTIKNQWKTLFEADKPCF